MGDGRWSCPGGDGGRGGDGGYGGPGGGGDSIGIADLDEDQLTLEGASCLARALGVSVSVEVESIAGLPCV
jgi:hypothetical protein